MKRAGFCENCDDMRPFALKRVPVEEHIRGKTYRFYITKAICLECGNEVSLPGLLDMNTREIDFQYRKEEGIISISEIRKLMKLYHMGKSTLSLALGFGEITVTRYLDGQVPSQAYSKIMYEALSSAAFMREKLKANREAVGESAYKKALKAIHELDDSFTHLPSTLIDVISFIFQNETDITPLMLQKLLYYANGIHDALLGRPLFTSRCEAWIHGPVYRDVYDVFKNFKFNLIDDERSALLLNSKVNLTPEDRNLISNILNSFGMYSGKMLEYMTHQEDPWRKAREGYGPDEYSQVEITEESIKQYFLHIPEYFDMDKVEGMRAYITRMLK